MFKKVCLVGLAAAAFSFAQEETYVRNICDTLPSSPTPKVELKLAYVDETQWFGSKDLSKTDSSSVNRFKDYKSLVPLRNKFSDRIPVSVMAGCAETKRNAVKFAEWSESNKAWTLNEDNTDFATYIMDANIVELPGYDPSKAYNFLGYRKGSLPSIEEGFTAEELLISRTYEFQFDWWYTVAAYKVITTKQKDDGSTSQSISWKMTSIIAMDSISSVRSAVDTLLKTAPDTLTKIQYQQFHVVLMDANKIPSETVSSSSEAVSSSSVASSSSVESSSSTESSSSAEPSSSDSPTAIGRLETSPRAFGAARAVRRLDGSLVKSGEQLVPGIYYVKGADGRWKKQVELP